MKSLFKVTLLATTMAVALHAPLTLAADAATKDKTAATDSKSAFKNDDQKSAYALGASLGRYMENSLKEQEKLGIKLDKDQLIAGVQDAFADKSKLSDQEIEQTLQAFETRVKTAAQDRMEKDATENETKGKAFRDAFAKEKGVKTSSTGLLYKVDKAGTGDAPKDSDTVVVNYKGTLIDGKEFDNSYTRGEPLSFRLDGVIPGWTEGLKNIKKGGKIKLVIPPALAYGKTGVPGIPANSTLVFDVELLDIKPAPKADAAAPEAAPAAGDKADDAKDAPAAKK
ncbi:MULTISPECIES: FKBP-type peptidyl-prolyl cis-trans isomerase [Kosakonia]|jgi:FKBP-type peptidyl-prolyl cis-trans isomerase FkpA|uniref:Peptidyl-prolyl cis-trans isomerase n=2 Tax=Gammaproteobacteria TaxID=1236 RepID=A0A807LFD2_9ENTR|nr:MULTISPECIES: FKBP-type peptidyl-prolyl cis-trans isomerase [Kosakonia]MDP9769380.1 FKBP-type peptidyl-prolyl cis-trans isomerase FkpA [Atlantibacter hermannii]APZ05316.1 FKBP-type peptidyl-prolyl cis-trans isomerase FkpA [Kosakonia cowanii JCM 10956 = DSM 18146]MDM9618506.1 FKBP-type peptidyl-prolyl cis-trans isomerase [Kosakonia cowanii]MDP4563573.1 FKBP-type peptidyl-prolyl cis-trans isomerase [Kosakonia cowanii]MDY0885967.1 FKBP-type peptidyl-prolyl cis-trans isomerase [Kosakonia sp. CF